MVASRSALTYPVARQQTAKRSEAIEIEFATDLTAVEADWRHLELSAIGSPFQRFDFVDTWMRHLGPVMNAEPLIITGRKAGRIAFIVPLVVIRKGPFRIAQFAGGPHATSNFGLFDNHVWPDFSSEDVSAIYGAVAERRPDVHLIHLTGQPLEVGGRPNPFIDSRSHLAAHHAYDLSLDGGFDGVLSRHRGAKKRKKMRSVAREFDKFGNTRFYRAENPKDARTILDAFFEQKAIRFAEMNIPNVFACPKTRGFFHHLADRSFEGNGRTIECYALEVGGIIRATSIGAPFDKTQYYVMNSFATDELARHSPGETAVFHFIEHCAGSGFNTFNFGIGDARYKRSWCDRELHHYETLLPLNLLGATAAGFEKGKRRLRDYIVARPRLFSVVQTLRRRSVGKGDDEGQAED